MKVTGKIIDHREDKKTEKATAATESSLFQGLKSESGMHRVGDQALLRDPEVYEEYNKREKEIEIAWYEAEEGYEQSGALQENDLFASYAEQEVAEQE